MTLIAEIVCPPCPTRRRESTGTARIVTSTRPSDSSMITKTSSGFVAIALIILSSRFSGVHFLSFVRLPITTHHGAAAPGSVSSTGGSDADFFAFDLFNFSSSFVNKVGCRGSVKVRILSSVTL
jgi:hypothetical protein